MIVMMQSLAMHSFSISLYMKKNAYSFPIWEKMKIIHLMLALPVILFNLCFSNEVFTVACRKNPSPENPPMILSDLV
jgi:hypothetical protein